MPKDSTALRVMVVEDDPLMRWAVTETLTEDGYDVIAAGDGREATELLRRSVRPIDVVMLDYVLPDCSDLSLLEAIRREAPDARVILMTAFGQAEVFRHALELGACSVVLKPFEMYQLPQLVATAHAVRPETH